MKGGEIFVQRKCFAVRYLNFYFIIAVLCTPAYNAHVANFAFNNYCALGYEADSGVQ